MLCRFLNIKKTLLLFWLNLIFRWIVTQNLPYGKRSILNPKSPDLARLASCSNFDFLNRLSNFTISGWNMLLISKFLINLLSFYKFKYGEKKMWIRNANNVLWSLNAIVLNATYVELWSLLFRLYKYR